MFSSLMFWGSVIMFPRTYWFVCTKTLETMYVVGRLTPQLVKKVIDYNKKLEYGESSCEDSLRTD